MQKNCPFWTPLQPDFDRCGNGMLQSPIDIRDADSVSDLPIEFSYSAVPLTMSRSGGRLSIAVSGDASIRVAGKTFNLVEIHFHSPGEHAIAGHIAPMEMHMVHRSAEDALAVVGFNLELDDQAHPALQTIFNHVPSGPEGSFPAAGDPGTHLDLASIVASVASYFNYVGSLTTPPYSEGVLWLMMNQDLKISPSLLSQFQAIGGCPNARELHPRNDRALRFFS